jgi:membrane protease YdiL (CAAX protease family)
MAALLIALHRDLLLWLLRRPLPLAGGEFGTTRGNAVWPFLVLITLTTPVEIAAIELLLPEELWWLRAALAIAAVELLILAWALYASLVRHPLLVAEDGLWLRWGAFLRFRLAYGLIDGVQVARRQHPTGQFGMVFYPPHRPEGYLTSSARVDVTIRLSRPVLLPGGWFTRARKVECLHIGVDRPEEFAGEVERRRLENSAAEPGLPAAGEAIGRLGKLRSGGLSLLLLSLVLEGLLAMFGFFWIEQQGRDLTTVIGFSGEGTAGGILAGVVAFAATILVHGRLAPRLGPLRRWRRWVEEQLVPFLEPVGVWTALGISISAGVGEELFFRGAMQPVFGIPITALLFALAHVGGLLRREALPLFFFTLLLGLAVGWAYHQIGVLWPLIVAHAVIDFLIILWLRRLRSPAAVPES